MAKRHGSPRASSAPATQGGIVRWIVALIGGLAAVYSAVFAFGVVYDTRNPAAVVALGLPIPNSTVRIGSLRVALALQRAVSANGATPSGAEQAAALAASNLSFTPQENADIAGLSREALKLSALNSTALRLLATVEGEPARREALLRLSQRVSRRDVLTALQLAEVDFRGGKSVEALTGINRALVVSSALDQTVFPLLAGAAQDEVGRGQLRTLLAKDPIWAERLVRWAMANPGSLPALSTVVGAIPRGSIALDVGFGQQMVDLLSSQRRYAQAFAVQRAYGKSAPSISNLTAATFTPLDWKLLDNYDTGSRPFEKEALEAFANPGRAGNVAEIVTRIAPGSHRLVLRLTDVSGRGGTLRLSASCAGAAGDRAIASRSLPLTNGTAILVFNVEPTGCDFQRISIGLGAEEESTGVVIRSAALQGAGGAASAQ